MNKLLSIAGAFISMLFSVSAKAEPPKVPPKDNTSVEDYTNNIVEYDDFDVSYTKCTAYGARTPTYDACHNRTDRYDGCSVSFIRCATDNSQCLAIKGGDIVELNPNRLQSHTRQNDRDANHDVSPQRHKYSVTTKIVGVKVTTCNASKGKNETKTILAAMRKMCAIDVPGKGCVCHIIKDNCGNYIDENGRAVYVDQSNDGSCLGQLGKSVNCDSPEFLIVGDTVSGEKKPRPKDKTLDRAAMRDSIKDANQKAVECGLDGDLIVQFDLSDNKARNVKVVGGSLKGNAAVEKCIVAIVKKHKWPDGVAENVKIPFRPFSR